MNKPTKPSKPTEPKKTYSQPNFVNERVYEDSSLFSVLEQLKDYSLEDFKKLYFEVDYEGDYYGGDNRYAEISLRGEVGNPSEIVNKNYEKEYKKYLKKMTVYEEKMIEYKEKLKEYKKFEKEQEELRKQKEIEMAKQILKKNGITTVSTTTR